MGSVSGDPLPALRCPLCGELNQCAPAREGHFAVACWCRAVRIEPATLQRIAPALRNRACICRACASAEED